MHFKVGHFLSGLTVEIERSTEGLRTGKSKFSVLSGVHFSGFGASFLRPSIHTMLLSESPYLISSFNST